MNVVGAGFIGAALFRVVGDSFIAGKFIVGAGRVRQYKMVLAVFVGEVEVNAFLLH